MLIKFTKIAKILVVYHYKPPTIYEPWCFDRNTQSRITIMHWGSRWKFRFANAMKRQQVTLVWIKQRDTKIDLRVCMQVYVCLYVVETQNDTNWQTHHTSWTWPHADGHWPTITAPRPKNKVSYPYICAGETGAGWRSAWFERRIKASFNDVGWRLS